VVFANLQTIVVFVAYTHDSEHPKSSFRSGKVLYLCSEMKSVVSFVRSYARYGAMVILLLFSAWFTYQQVALSLPVDSFGHESLLFIDDNIEQGPSLLVEETHPTPANSRITKQFDPAVSYSFRILSYSTIIHLHAKLMPSHISAVNRLVLLSGLRI
jgi:hypothetical protein